jgi:hypothetical protein
MLRRHCCLERLVPKQRMSASGSTRELQRSLSGRRHLRAADGDEHVVRRRAVPARHQRPQLRGALHRRVPQRRLQQRLRSHFWSSVTGSEGGARHQPTCGSHPLDHADLHLCWRGGRLAQIRAGCVTSCLRCSAHYQQVHGCRKQRHAPAAPPGR